MNRTKTRVNTRDSRGSSFPGEGDPVSSRGGRDEPRRGRQPVAGEASDRVRVWVEEVVLPTYLPAPPDKNPMFLEKRVYQGSSGRVYPLPFTDRIAEGRVDRRWQGVWLENAYLRVLVLPEIGGRIHLLQDRASGYDLIYRQNVIKPALVGLAGPWISGGVEFNWPQHHRPATFLPVDFHVEQHADGSKTLWCGDHDPMARMKGMHGVCLHPGSAAIELKARVYNRTPFVQTFLWWTNIATHVHEAYQSFFPPDVHCVADHAKRAVSQYPLCRGIYYGVNYGERRRKGVPKNEVPTNFVPPHCLPRSGLARSGSPAATSAAGSVLAYPPNDLSWYANIPTPCSYMAMGSRHDFFGGYDHFRQAGLVHIADHHISPGKKQWTWGNHEFGYAWDRNLTEADGPYIELMAGVYTDNQPDFSFLQPGETKTWSQCLYPIRKIGPAQHANARAALSLTVGPGQARLGVCVSAPCPDASVSLSAQGKELALYRRDLHPGTPLVETVNLSSRVRETDLALRVADGAGREIIAYTPQPRLQGPLPPPASEPPPPQKVASTDELYLIGLHLEQYRHATRCPTIYWREALRRDPLDSRCNNALGLWRLRRGEFLQAEHHFRTAIERLVRLNPNPRDGEAHYNLGLCLRYQLDASQDPACPRAAETLFQESYAAFHKSAWDQAWAATGCHALAELDCRRHRWVAALQHLERSLRANSDNLRARNLKTIVLRRLGRNAEAEALVRDTLRLDPLDWWARHLSGTPVQCDLQTRLDIAHDLARAGFYAEGIALLQDAQARERDLPDQSWGAAPMVAYTRGWLHEQSGGLGPARVQYRQAAALPPDYCFPARLEEIAVLQAAIRANPKDARAPYYLGNLLYDRRRHGEAIARWEQSVKLDPGFSVAWRNVGLGCFNILKRPTRARAAYDRACRAAPADARLLFERDQLWKRLGVAPAKRLAELERHLDLVRQRDDLSVELCALYNQTGRHEDALALVSNRRFQPWEGGEGQALGQYVRTHLALGRRALDEGAPDRARNHFGAALNPPRNLGEARHLLANPSDIHYWLGCAAAAQGQPEIARQHWRTAAASPRDFQEMRIRDYSELTYYSALARERLGQKNRAHQLFRSLLAYGCRLQKAPAGIDYFATSLPTLLLFEDDLSFRQETTALFLQAQAWLGLGRKRRARTVLRAVLKRDPNHAMAADLLESF